MWQCCLTINYIFVLHVISQIHCGYVEANRSTKSESLSDIAPTEKCKFMFCSCADFLKLPGVYCEGNADIISSLTFSDSVNLTKGVLEGLRVYFILLDDPEITVAENFLEGIIALSEIMVKESSIEIIPDFRHAQYTIRDIRILSSRLTSLEGKNLQNLNAVSVLDFSENYISDIDPDVFKGTENVIILNLSHNQLTYIPPKLLDPMKKLDAFLVSHNNLRSVDSLFSVTKPTTIALGFNDITNASSIFRFNMEDHRESIELNGGRYHRLFDGITLDLSFNCIKETPKSFYSYYMNTNNDTPIFIVHTLLLDGNELKYLSTSLRYTLVRRLYVSQNKIEYLTDEDFLFVYRTEDLELQHNEIRRVDTLTFQQIRAYLRRLDLSSNKIASINGSVRNLSVLSELFLRNNAIQFIAEDEFIGLQEVSVLNLDLNHIKNLGQLQHLSKLTNLKVKYNALVSLRLDQLPKSLRSMDISDNNFKCDCHLQKFIGWIKANGYIKTDTELCLKSHLENSLQEMKDCPDMCSCRCTENLEVPFMFVDCSSKNLSVIPEFLKSNIKEKKANEMFFQDGFSLVMAQNTYHSLYFEDRVSGISLENNSLKYIDAAFLPSNLNLLYLSNNKLSFLPEYLIDNQLNLKQVSLSGNPWKCDCNSLKFRNWLISKYRTIIDIDKVLCGISDTGDANLNGRIIWKLTNLDLCPITDIEQVVTVSLCIFLSFITICFAAKIIYRKHELNVKMFLYSRGFHFVKKEDNVMDKEFDAFMSFSHTDDELIIKEIISPIEFKDPNIRLCLHYRHFIAGEFITDNITYAVQNSKMTVLFLSRNFLESEWCLLEFRTAHMQSLQDKMHKIIVVKVGDLPKKIDPEIKFYLDSTTYLTWGENRFWEKLLFVLPSKNPT